MEYLKEIQKIQRIVVKVGTSTLTHSTGKLNFNRLEQLVRQLSDLRNQGKEVVLVTSGAVGAGMGRLGLTKRPASIVERQALAAIGQGLLMQIYEKLFAEYGQVVAQVLLTRSDVSERQRYLNARNRLLALLNYQVIPIINENDTVATEELKIGENDALSALVTGLIDGELLVLLSDIDGLYTSDPKQNPDAELIPCVPEITPEIRQMAGGAGSSFGTGGMITKLNAAQMATSAGAMMVLMNGKDPSKLQQLFEGKPVGTVFLSKHSVVNHRKRWIAYGPQIGGELVIDRGAERAKTTDGKSLLPSGIIRISGNFEEGDLVRILSIDGTEIGRGFTNYNREQLSQIIGKKTSEIEKILGFKNADEVVHRDNFVLTVS